MKPEERIVEKEKIVYYEDEERINDLNDRINDLEAEICKIFLRKFKLNWKNNSNPKKMNITTKKFSTRMKYNFFNL
jgi:hypothetical protein